ncbi:MAG: TatD family hydrolase [Paludibacteraceae bacterium]|nr:TatD family hydrolase [Paludibacteraceae bacterium]
MKIVDTHCHLDDPQFAEDLDFVVKRAKDAGVYKVLLASVSMFETEKMLAVEAAYPGFCYAMVGVHPQEVNAENYKRQIELFDIEIERRPYIAVGEIGMDLYWDKSTRAEQEVVFRHQVAAAVERGLPISIHSRDAFEPTVNILREFDPAKLRGVLHCFSSAPDNAKVMMSLGDFYFGIGGVSTFKNAKFTERLSEIPLERILLETDAPYLAPVPMRGKRNEPSFLVHVAGKLASVYGVSVDDICRITSENAEKLFFFEK